MIQSTRTSKKIVQPDPAFLKPLLVRQLLLGSHTGLRLKGTDKHRQNHVVKTNAMNLEKMKHNVKGFFFLFI